MKKVLIITFIFPPLAGAGVQRTLKFVKYLLDFNIQPIVITTDKNTYGAKDYSLLDEVPEKIEVFRIKSFYLMNLMPKFRFLKLNQVISLINRKLIIPDGSIFWAKKVTGFVEKMIESKGINLIYTTGGPFSTHLIGIYLKKKFPYLKWVADFRDEWTTNPHVKLLWFRKMVERRLEFNVIKLADKLITISDIMRNNIYNNFLNYIKKRYKKNKLYNIDLKFEIIANGYDENDFKFLNEKIIKDNKRDNKFLKIGYNGGMYTRRNPYYVFKAISELIEEYKIDKNSIKLFFTGYKGILIRKPIKKYNLEKLIILKGYMQHIDSIKFMNEMDILLLIIGNFKGSESIITGKIYEYLRLGKPIFLLGPENGLAWELIKKYSCGYRCDINDIKCIKNTLLKIYEDFINNKIKKCHNHETIKMFERKFLTKKLAKIFSDL